MKKNVDHKYGFTLVELLVVVGIIGLIVGAALPNFLGARQRARDSKRKDETIQLKAALRLYYNDYQRYPPACNGGVGKLNYISGCGSSVATGYPAACCPEASCNADFAGGPTTCDATYMKQFPSDLGSRMYYRLAVSGTEDFCISVTLENTSDPDIAKSQSKCASACGANCTGSTTFCACAD